MAKITKVQLNDTINVHRLRFNQLIDSIGDLALLDANFISTDVVGAINELNGRVPLNPFDSAEAIALIDSDHVQLRQDYAYSSLTGTPNVLDSADVLSIIPNVLDSADVSSIITADTTESSNSLTGTTPSIDVQAYELYYHTSTDNTQYTFTNAPSSGTVQSFILNITAGGTHTFQYPAEVVWANGSQPSAPDSGETDVLVFMTYDSGATYYGFQAGDNMS